MPRGRHLPRRRLTCADHSSLEAGLSALPAAVFMATQISDETQAQLTKSYAGAETIAQQYPQYADQITAAARQAFLQGDKLAYSAGAIAVLAGAAIVFFLFPRHDTEERLLAEYRAADESPADPAPAPGSTATL